MYIMNRHLIYPLLGCKNKRGCCVHMQEHLDPSLYWSPLADAYPAFVSLGTFSRNYWELKRVNY